ncbi:MAG: anthranilate phosphoribosyltransferase [Gammaproteobacteria bacterium]|nr:anthranilate phosphoribosyltransferase [Gammaproteobacteria bacterium]
MEMSEAIRAVTESRDLDSGEMQSVMRRIMTGGATPAQIGGFLVGLRMKGETVDEITAAAQVMRELVTRVEVADDHLVDTCGTGGDASGTFNISTGSAFVAAAAGARVAKHGNRSVSSKSGSADVLEAAGVRLDLTPPQVARCIQELGVGFMFAPLHHGAMKHAIGPRREMGIRTVFNILGPLTNPAGAPNQLLGVFSASLVEPMARVLANLGSRHVMVVHADDGMDEISLSGATQVAELRDNEIHRYAIHPGDFGMASAARETLLATDAEGSLALIRQAFAEGAGPTADVLALNAGAAIYVAGVADSLAQGVERARVALRDGSAAARLDALCALTAAL